MDLPFELILASQSPRRSQLLELAGIPFRVQAVPIEETYPEELPADRVAPYLAEQKAIAARSLLERDDQVLLTADSIVVLDNEIFGKPADRAEALATIRRLSGREHIVYTGFCLKSRERTHVGCGESRVHFSELSEAEIAFYVDTYQPYDKAGAYAIQEWIGLCKIRKIEGTHANIMGLPVDLVYEGLQQFR
jgi:septum formation protein